MIVILYDQFWSKIFSRVNISISNKEIIKLWVTKIVHGEASINCKLLERIFWESGDSLTHKAISIVCRRVLLSPYSRLCMYSQREKNN